MIKYNLISDTVTKPSKEMLEYMFQAEVGDDVFGEDPTVNSLEERLAEMFGMEAGLFCPSGTMTNQIALKMHTEPLDELICEQSSHIFQYESAGYAYNSGVAVNPITGQDGQLSPDLIAENVKPEADWLPKTKIVFIENTCNRAGGKIYSLDNMRQIHKVCKENDLILHLDGARIFNAIVCSDYEIEDLKGLFDSISICLSKGLGCPVGSVLLSSQEHIRTARRIRKVMGGGMRQAGILAAAGHYALDNNINDLKSDYEKALIISEALKNLNVVEFITPVETNIIICNLKSSMNAQTFCQKLENVGIRGSAFGSHKVRLVTHRDITLNMIDEIRALILNLEI